MGPVQVARALLLVAAASCGALSQEAQEQCSPVPLTLAECQGISYNETSSSVNQAEMNKSMGMLRELVNSPCAPFVRLFVCGMHAPMCRIGAQVRVCREMCQRVKQLCLPFLLATSFEWPRVLACEPLPRDPGPGVLCMGPSNNAFEKELRRLQPRRQLALGRLKKSQRPPPPPPEPDSWPQPPPMSPTTSTTRSQSPQSPSSRRGCSQAELRLGAGQSATCARRCFANLLFAQEDKDFAVVWMQIWSVICLVSTSLAVATFVLDSERFRFPERPMVWVSACYLLYSGAHLLRAGLGPEIACSRLQGPSSQLGLYRVSRHAGHWCAVVFLLLYFSSLAGCLWWVMLTVCWYLCAAKKWAHEALSNKTMWLHVCAWGLPLLLSVVLLVLHRIEGDELTHLCVVDGSDRLNTLVFVIVPTSVCLLVGLCFLISALCSTISVRHSLKFNGDENFRRLEKLMTKISLFSFLFVLPSVCVLAANIYEYLQRDSWTASLEAVLAVPACANASGLVPSHDSRCQPERQPSSAFFMLKIFMSLAVGLPSGLIVWFNCKSASAWQRCCSRVVLRRRPKPAEAVAAFSTGGVSVGKRQQEQLLGSSQRKYPPLRAASGASAV